MKKAATLLCLFTLFVACGRKGVPQSNPAVVNELIITGNHRVPTGTIKANIHSQPGAVNQATLHADIERLRSMGVFVDDISASDGVRAHILQIHVKDDLTQTRQ